jgi:type II secretory pathway pseudopilin PulG
MRNSKLDKTQARSGFSLAELVVLLALLCIVGAFAMPRLYESRMALNENAAKEVLLMLASAQTVWREEMGSYARLRSISFAPGDPSDLEPFLPFLQAGELGFTNLGGYRYTQTLNSSEMPDGCVAEPITRGFSGKAIFSLNYATGELTELEPALED